MLPGPAAADGAAPAPATTDVTFTGQTEKHRDVAEFMTRLGLIPQLMGITLTSSTDASSTTTTTTASSAPTVTYTQFTVTAQLRPYTTHAAHHHAVDGGGAMRARGREIYIITAVVAVGPHRRLVLPALQSHAAASSATSTSRSSRRRARWTMANQEVVKLESYKKTAPQSRAEIVRLGKMLPES